MTIEWRDTAGNSCSATVGDLIRLTVVWASYGTPGYMACLNSQEVSVDRYPSVNIAKQHAVAAARDALAKCQRALDEA